MYQEIPVEAFNGLDLRSDPIEVGAGTALDLLNVDFDGPGRVRARDGASKFNTTAPGSGTNVWLLAGQFSGASRLCPIRSDAGTLKIDTLTGTGTLSTAVATFGAGFTEVHDSAMYGNPTVEQAYISMRGQTLQKFSGAALSNSVGKPRYVKVWGTRVVQANYAAGADSPSGSNGSKHTVFFSDPGAPDTYTASNFVTLGPGDGAEIVGMAVWGDELFVFKNAAVFVFSTPSVDGTGLPVFNYRQVALPMGVSIPPAVGSGGGYPPVVAAGTDGVYFASPAGIFRTQGGPPQEVSFKVQGVFTGTAADTVASSHSQAAVYWAGEKLFFMYSTRGGGGPSRALVWDRLTDQWSLWDFVTAAVVSWDGQSSIGKTSTYFLANSSLTNVFYFNPNATADNGVSVSWYYQSGNYPLANGQRTTIREVLLTGTGTVTLKMSVDMGSVDTGGTVTLAVDPAVSEGRQRIARQGKFFSHYISGAGPATINRLTHHVREARVVA